MVESPLLITLSSTGCGRLLSTMAAEDSAGTLNASVVEYLPDTGDWSFISYAGAIAYSGRGWRRRLMQNNAIKAAMIRPAAKHPMATPAVAPLEIPFLLAPPTPPGNAVGLPLIMEEPLESVGAVVAPGVDEPTLVGAVLETVPELLTEADREDDEAKAAAWEELTDLDDAMYAARSDAPSVFSPTVAESR